MTAHETLQLIARLLAGVAILQSYEFLKISKATGALGVWRWSVIERELGGNSRLLRKVFGFFLSDSRFPLLNFVRLLVAVSVVIIPTAAGVSLLLFLHVLTLLRWLGSFNGGSDSMNLLLLVATSLGLALPEQGAVVCLWYVTFHVVLSYVKAGWVKVTTTKWRNGSALREFLRSPTYDSNPFVTWLTIKRRLVTLATWSVLVFELSFPLSLLQPNVALAYLGAGFVFHLTNAYAFGLNRFLWTWLAAYPAVYYCAF